MNSILRDCADLLAHLDDAHAATDDPLARHLLKEAREAVATEEFGVVRWACRTALDRHLTSIDTREHTRSALRIIEKPELVADGAGTISSGARVECFECGAEATGFDERASVHLCDDCDSVTAVTDHEAVVRACSFVESDARFVVICFDCRRSDSFVEETEAVEQARDDDRTHDCECGGEYELVVNAATDAGVRHTDPSVSADLEDCVPRCRKCGEVIVVRSGPAYERCVECLLDEFGAAETDRWRLISTRSTRAGESRCTSTPAATNSRTKPSSRTSTD